MLSQLATENTYHVAATSDAATAVANGSSSSPAMPLEGAGTVPTMVPMNFSEKLEKFNGLNLKR